MAIYQVSEETINNLVYLLEKKDSKKSDLQFMINKIKQSEVKEDRQEKQREAARKILDFIVELQPEFTELPYMAMKNIVDQHITTIIAEIAWYGKTNIDERLPKYSDLS